MLKWYLQWMREMKWGEDLNRCQSSDLLCLLPLLTQRGKASCVWHLSPLLSQGELEQEMKGHLFLPPNIVCHNRFILILAQNAYVSSASVFVSPLLIIFYYPVQLWPSCPRSWDPWRVNWKHAHKQQDSSDPLVYRHWAAVSVHIKVHSYGNVSMTCIFKQCFGESSWFAGKISLKSYVSHNPTAAQ